MVSPISPSDRAPESAGAQLLARAGATDRRNPQALVDLPATSQVDQVMIDRMMEWLNGWLHRSEAIGEWFRVANRPDPPNIHR